MSYSPPIITFRGWGMKWMKFSRQMVLPMVFSRLFGVQRQQDHKYNKFGFAQTYG
jgi:hypothetical protein